MDISKELNKIIDDFYAVYEKYQEAIKKGDRQSVIKYGKELANYLGEHKEMLDISEEYIVRLKKALDDLEKDFVKAVRQKKQAKNLHLITEAEKQIYLQTLLKELRINKKHSGH